ncbi:MAG: ATP-binding cassette domain-containing protein [Bacteroidetes bacterium]|nr:MAG: ATP-binding cassette domain-containing protein [Bacteroidota bacterium]
MTHTPTLVKLEQLSLRLGDREILNGVSASLEKGTFVYLVGPTGVGKSSLLRLLFGDLRPQAGRLMVAGQAVHTLKASDLPYLRRRIGMVFQDYQLLPDRTVYENLRFVMKATGWRKAREMKRRANEVLMQVGLNAKAEARPHQLSGGEQQRIAIARALLNEPALLIADEPTGNLDPEATSYVMDILTQVHRAGTTVLMATHAYDLIYRYPGQVWELRDGTLQAYDSSPDFLDAYARRRS